MADEAQFKRLEGLIDGLAAAVTAGFAETADNAARLEKKVDAGFERVDRRIDAVERRLGNVETRLEGLESEFRAFRVDVQERVTSLESRPT